MINNEKKKESESEGFTNRSQDKPAQDNLDNDKEKEKD